MFKNVKKVLCLVGVLLMTVQCFSMSSFAADASNVKVNLTFDESDPKTWEMKENGWFLRNNSWNNPNNDISHGTAQVPVNKSGDYAMKVSSTSSVGVIDIYNDNGQTAGTIVDSTETRPYKFSADVMAGADNSEFTITADGICWFWFLKDGTIAAGDNKKDNLTPVGKWVKGAWYNITVIFYGSKETGDVYINDVKVAEDLKIRWNLNDLKPMYIKTSVTGSAFDAYVNNLKIEVLDSEADYVPAPSKLTSPHLYDGQLWYNFPHPDRATVSEVIAAFENPDRHELSVVGPCSNYLGDAAPYYVQRDEAHKDLRKSFLLEKDSNGNLLYMYPINALGDSETAAPLTFEEPKDLYAGRVMCDFKWAADSHDYAQLAGGVGGKEAGDRAALYSFTHDFTDDIFAAINAAAGNGRYYEAETIGGKDVYYNGVRAYWQPNGGFANIEGDTAKKVHFSFQIMMDSYEYAVCPRLGNTQVYPIRFDRDGVIGIGKKQNAAYREVGRWETNQWYTVDTVLDSSNGVKGDVYLDGVLIAKDADFGALDVNSNGNYNCLYMTMLFGKGEDGDFVPGNVYLDNIKCAVVDSFTPALSALSFADRIGNTLFTGRNQTARQVIEKAGMTGSRSAAVYDQNYTRLADTDVATDGCRLIETDTNDSSLLFVYDIKTSKLTNICLDKAKGRVTVAANAKEEVPAAGSLILAGFDAVGTLESVAIGSIAAGEAVYVAGENQYERAVVMDECFAFPETAATVKAFLWDDIDTMVPLCGGAE